jgi:hypothetical protein
MSNEQEISKEGLSDEQKEAFDRYFQFCVPYLFVFWFSQGLPAMIESMAKAKSPSSESTNQS